MQRPSHVLHHQAEMSPVYSILLLLAVLVALLGTSFAELGPEGFGKGGDRGVDGETLSRFARAYGYYGYGK
uniref:Glycine rich superfamily member n=1 Tax=Steinernema glaseri TaxID=37863 RepID=A0A1I7ZYZ9_9BILA